jgi:hypothetical protein
MPGGSDQTIPFGDSLRLIRRCYRNSALPLFHFETIIPPRHRCGPVTANMLDRRTKSSRLGVMGNNDDEVIHQHSGWLVPLGVIAALAALSALLMLYYLAPGGAMLFQEQISPTSRSEPVSLSVRGVKFDIPANYTKYESTRRGGVRHEIALFALLPYLTGWSNWQSDTFTDASANSRVIFLTLREDNNGLSEAARMERVYRTYIKSQDGKPGPYGLTQYEFRADSGYHDEDLFTGQTATGLIVLRCVRPSADVPNPSCLREVLIDKGVALTYRFQRAHLSEWRTIAERTDALLTSFRETPKR